MVTLRTLLVQLTDNTLPVPQRVAHVASVDALIRSPAAREAVRANLSYLFDALGRLVHDRCVNKRMNDEDEITGTERPRFVFMSKERRKNKNKKEGRAREAEE